MVNAITCHAALGNVHPSPWLQHLMTVDPHHVYLREWRANEEAWEQALASRPPVPQPGSPLIHQRAK